MKIEYFGFGGETFSANVVDSHEYEVFMLKNIKKELKNNYQFRNKGICLNFNFDSDVNSSDIKIVLLLYQKTEYSASKYGEYEGKDIDLSKTNFAYDGSIKDIKTDKLISIDPGVDTFITYYSLQGEWGKIGKDVSPKISKLREKERKIKEKFEENKKKVKSISSKINNKIINLIDDFHWNTTHFLLENFDKILIPRLYMSKCNKTVKEKQRDLRQCQICR